MEEQATQTESGFNWPVLIGVGAVVSAVSAYMLYRKYSEKPVASPASSRGIAPVSASTNNKTNDDKTVTNKKLACSYCKKEESGEVKLKACVSCKSVKYCSKACQAKDWREKHKNECEQLRRVESSPLNPKNIDVNSTAWEKDLSSTLIKLLKEYRTDLEEDFALVLEGKIEVTKRDWGSPCSIQLYKESKKNPLISFGLESLLATAFKDDANMADNIMEINKWYRSYYKKESPQKLVDYLADICAAPFFAFNANFMPIEQFFLEIIKKQDEETILKWIESWKSSSKLKPLYNKNFQIILLRLLSKANPKLLETVLALKDSATDAKLFNLSQQQVAQLVSADEANASNSKLILEASNMNVSDFYILSRLFALFYVSGNGDFIKKYVDYLFLYTQFVQHFQSQEDMDSAAGFAEITEKGFILLMLDSIQNPDVSDVLVSYLKELYEKQNESEEIKAKFEFVKTLMKEREQVEEERKSSMEGEMSELEGHYPVIQWASECKIALMMNDRSKLKLVPCKFGVIAFTRLEKDDGIIVFTPFEQQPQQHS